MIFHLIYQKPIRRTNDDDDSDNKGLRRAESAYFMYWVAKRIIIIQSSVFKSEKVTSKNNADIKKIIWL